jgi:mono/diheme cytochrome c family protein
VAYIEGPRLAAPAASVPLQGPVLIAGQPGSNPIPVTDDSLQRGQVLYDLYCALCHGKEGDGSGPVGTFFSPAPADLTVERVRGLSDSELYLTLSLGQGSMPSLAENLNMVERWDVINYLHQLTAAASTASQ